MARARLGDRQIRHARRIAGRIATDDHSIGTGIERGPRRFIEAAFDEHRGVLHLDVGQDHHVLRTERAAIGHHHLIGPELRVADMPDQLRAG